MNFDYCIIIKPRMCLISSLLEINNLPQYLQSPIDISVREDDSLYIKPKVRFIFFFGGVEVGEGKS